MVQPVARVVEATQPRAVLLGGHALGRPLAQSAPGAPAARVGVMYEQEGPAGVGGLAEAAQQLAEDGLGVVGQQEAVGQPVDGVQDAGAAVESGLGGLLLRDVDAADQQARRFAGPVADAAHRPAERPHAGRARQADVNGPRPPSGEDLGQHGLGGRQVVPHDERHALAPDEVLAAQPQLAQQGAADIQHARPGVEDRRGLAFGEQGAVVLQRDVRRGRGGLAAPRPLGRGLRAATAGS